MGAKGQKRKADVIVNAMWALDRVVFTSDQDL
jgi:hypothetical protein